MQSHIRAANRFGVGVAMALGVLGLAACGQGASNNSASSFDTQFNASFDKSTHDSCYSAATGKGAAADLAEKYCTCLVQQADKLTTQEKLALPTHTDQMNQMATTCNAQVQAGQAAAPASNAAP